MPISHSHRFLFVHVPKCAGTSILAGLKTACRIESSPPFDDSFCAEKGLGLTGRFHLSNKHLGAADQMKLVDETLFREYFKFTFVRNPYDRLFSYYNFLKRNRFKENWKPQIRLACQAASFREFVELALADQDEAVDLLFSQVKYLTDAAGQVLVDKIYKYENLGTDFRDVCRRLAVMPGLRSSLKDLFGVPRLDVPKLNAAKSVRRGFLQAYDTELKCMLQPRLANDLAIFNYTFDDEEQDREPVKCDTFDVVINTSATLKPATTDSSNALG